MLLPDVWPGGVGRWAAGSIQTRGPGTCCMGGCCMGGLVCVWGGVLRLCTNSGQHHSASMHSASMHLASPSSSSPRRCSAGPLPAPCAPCVALLASHDWPQPQYPAAARVASTPPSLCLVGRASPSQCQVASGAGACVAGRDSGGTRRGSGAPASGQHSAARARVGRPRLLVGRRLRPSCWVR
jgi:hypothetical protein